MEERDIVGHVRSVSPTFCERMANMMKYDSIGNTRAIGLIGCMEFVAEPNTRKKIDPSEKFAAKSLCQIPRSRGYFASHAD